MTAGSRRLYLDESGECSFSSASTCRYFTIGAVSVDMKDVPRMRGRLQRMTARMLNQGWDERKELKATTIFQDTYFGSETVIEIGRLLAGVPSLEVGYVVMDKRGERNEAYKAAGYGSVYDHCSGGLVSTMLAEQGSTSIHLLYDKGNGGRQVGRYLKTLVLGMEGERAFRVQGVDSGACYGLLAADVVAWSAFRSCEFKDNRFINAFGDRVKWRLEK
jgi:hypothetical protein